MIHILSVGSVVRKITKVNSYGYGKVRAWCSGCRELRPKGEFYRILLAPHPDSSTGLYYEPWIEYRCKACRSKLRKMPERQYQSRLRKTIRRSFDA